MNRESGLDDLPPALKGASYSFEGERLKKQMETNLLWPCGFSVQLASLSTTPACNIWRHNNYLSAVLVCFLPRQLFFSMAWPIPLLRNMLPCTFLAPF